LHFAARVVELAESLPATIAGRRIGDQLLRCRTSVGANYEEAQGAESRADFIHTLQIALKEVRESNYWLRLLAHTYVRCSEQLLTITNESAELKAILSKAVVTAKANARKDP
jgi:four helix bundle protein